MKSQKHDNSLLKDLRALSSSELRVYVVLLILSGPDHHIVRHSLSQLARLSGLSTGTVSRAVGELCRKGHISYKPGDNQHRSATFQMGKPVAGLQFGMADKESRGAEDELIEAKKEGCSEEKQDSAPISKRDISKLDIDIEAGREGYTPRSREEALAMEIAHAFHDMDGIALYMDYCRRYPEHIIRRAYGEVKELPDSAIRRSRGALFNYLVQKYAKGEDEKTDTKT